MNLNHFSHNFSYCCYFTLRNLVAHLPALSNIRIYNKCASLKISIYKSAKSYSVIGTDLQWYRISFVYIMNSVLSNTNTQYNTSSNSLVPFTHRVKLETNEKLPQSAKQVKIVLIGTKNVFIQQTSISALKENEMAEFSHCPYPSCLGR